MLRVNPRKLFSFRAINSSLIFGCFLILGMTACGKASENSAANALDNAGSAVRSLGAPPFYYNNGQPVSEDPVSKDGGKVEETEEVNKKK